MELPLYKLAGSLSGLYDVLGRTSSVSASILVSPNSLQEILQILDGAKTPVNFPPIVKYRLGKSDLDRLLQYDGVLAISLIGEEGTFTQNLQLERFSPIPPFED